MILRTEIIEFDLLGARFTDIASEASSAILQGLREAAFISEIIVAAKTPVDEGLTRAAWRTAITPTGAELVNDSPVALYLEEGTRPHRPPLLPIVRWLSRKEGRGAAVETLADADDDIVARAMGIVASIARNGTKAHYMLQGSRKEIAKVTRQRIDKQLKRRIG